MRRSSFLAGLLLALFSATAYSQEKQLAGVDGCFILFDLKANKQVAKYGDKRCAEQVAACSTFKVPLALMAFDRKVLKDESTELKWDGIDREIKSWNRDHTAASWLSNSVVWYSQALTPKLGKDVVGKYLADFGFGNHDMSGGITTAWLTVGPLKEVTQSTLKISADQQLEFFKRLWRDQLPVSKHASATTKKITHLEKSPNGYDLSGKTGSGYLVHTKEKKVRIGWFVAHLQGNKQDLVAVTAFTDYRKDPPYQYAGLAAKDITKSILSDLGFWSKQ
jgi:beta-lactamase class D